MRWLITVPRGTDLEELRQAVTSAHASLRDLDPVPLGDEVVVFAEGPPDFAQRLDSGDLTVSGVHPDSEQQPY